MTLHCYRIDPVDFWVGVTPVSVIMQDRSLDEIFRICQKIARADLGWEGVYRDAYGPCFIGLPDRISMQVCFMWKQEDGGDTFVFSPHELPWLNAHRYVKRRLEEVMQREVTPDSLAWINNPRVPSWRLVG